MSYTKCTLKESRHVMCNFSVPFNFSKMEPCNTVLIKLCMVIMIAKAEDSGSLNLKDEIDWSKWTTIEGERAIITNRPKISATASNRDEFDEFLVNLRFEEVTQTDKQTNLETNKPKLHLDWSKWTTIEGERAIITNRPKISATGSNRDDFDEFLVKLRFEEVTQTNKQTNLETNKPTLHLDWSRWTTPGSTTPSKPEILSWFNEVTTEIIPIKHLLTNLAWLPRKPKLKDQDNLQGEDTSGNAGTMRWTEEIRKKEKNNENDNNKDRLGTYPKSKGDIQRKPVRRKLYNNTLDQINRGTPKTGLDWSRWNETSESSQKPETTAGTQTDLAALIESESKDVLSLAGWPWYAWLIVSIITLIMLGIVYVAIFHVECRDCVADNGEAFCVINRREYN